MVVPPGEVTIFLSSAVVKLDSFIKLIVPKIISFTSSSESFFCNPPLKPPSLKASIINAIIALIIEALSDGGLSGGLQKKLSEELVMEMILGTVSLIKETNLTTAELKNMVTSPGGTTISALRVLENRSLRSALIEAVVSASNRSKEFR